MLGGAGLLVGGSAQAGDTRDAAPLVTTTGTSAYTCFVTYPGGSTNVSYSLTFTASAPATVAPHGVFAATVDFPVITPNPAINEQVQSVRAVFELPAGAYLLSTRLSGGSGIVGPAPRVHVEDGAVVVEAAGPFPAATPFQLPSLTLYLAAGDSGTLVLAQDGATLSDPAFSWVRTDLTGTPRPFACFLPAGTPLTSTTVTP
jgi:dehydratase